MAIERLPCNRVQIGNNTGFTTRISGACSATPLKANARRCWRAFHNRPDQDRRVRQRIRTFNEAFRRIQWGLPAQPVRWLVIKAAALAGSFGAFGQILLNRFRIKRRKPKFRAAALITCERDGDTTAGDGRQLTEHHSADNGLNLNEQSCQILITCP